VIFHTKVERGARWEDCNRLGRVLWKRAQRRWTKQDVQLLNEMDNKTGEAREASASCKYHGKDGKGKRKPGNEKDVVDEEEERGSRYVRGSCNVAKVFLG
jgi:hypothetical protein